ncbi:uncharacterized protein LOC143245597 [Tachypleus tridentatus]|uniref:uncharacterized protein LOC143245597 n=1 Tax=Tachypleus tridentatus TaxID=6853 RepID=UPI003FD09B61
MKGLDMDSKDLQLIEILHWNQITFIRTKEGSPPDIQIKIVVHQECVLSLCIFNLGTENIFHSIESNKDIKIGGMVINNLKYADVTVPMAATEKGKYILNYVNNTGKMYGMKMNAKTKSMLISRHNNKSEIQIKIEEKDIYEVEKFTFLGQTITGDEKYSTKIGLTSKMCKNEENHKVLYMVNSIICPWTFTQAFINKLEAFEKFVCRKMMEISWIDKVINEEILSMVNVKRYVVPTIKKRKVTQFGHIMR